MYIKIYLFFFFFLFYFFLFSHTHTSLTSNERHAASTKKRGGLKTAFHLIRNSALYEFFILKIFHHLNAVCIIIIGLYYILLYPQTNVLLLLLFHFVEKIINTKSHFRSPSFILRYSEHLFYIYPFTCIFFLDDVFVCIKEKGSGKFEFLLSFHKMTDSG